VKKIGWGLLLAMLGFACTAVSSAAPVRGLPQQEIALESDDSLGSIAGWLRLHGRDGYIGADVADAIGIPRSKDEDLVAALQRGFRTDEVLRVAQVSPDEARDFILFMVQRPDDHVFFYLCTALGGLQKAFVSIPSKSLVVPLERAEAELRFRHEVLYWKDRSEAR
jgi:hypothetical protein